MRRLACAVIAVSLFFSAVTFAEAPDPGARASIVIERASGRVVYQDNADRRYPMASITKIMTALLAVELCSMDEVVIASTNASGMPGTSIYLGVGERLTMRQMLLGLMLRSGNDAAVAIAEHIDGDVAAFAERMNARAAALHADAHFVNPHGLDARGHEITARGMALIAREAMGQPDFREIVSTKRAIIPWVDNEYQRVLQNKNRLLTGYDGATGIKTGFTDDAGRCLVFSAERDGLEYIGVLLNCGPMFASAEALLDWCFDAYQPVRVAVEGDVLGEVRVRGGERQTVGALCKQDLVIPVADGEDWTMALELPEYLNAPVAQGQVIGRARVEIGGQVVVQINLIAAEEIGAWNFPLALGKMMRLWAFGW